MELEQGDKVNLGQLPNGTKQTRKNVFRRERRCRMQCSRYVAPKPTSSSPALSQLPRHVSKAQGGFLWSTGGGHPFGSTYYISHEKSMSWSWILTNTLKAQKLAGCPASLQVPSRRFRTSEKRHSTPWKYKPWTEEIPGLPKYEHLHKVVCPISCEITHYQNNTHMHTDAQGICTPRYLAEEAVSQERYRRQKVGLPSAL